MSLSKEQGNEMMALSNWDCFAVNEKNEPINGLMISPLGIRIECYKNWISIHDDKAWEDGGQFTKSCIMQIQHGSIRYKDVYIEAIRGPQDGIYFVVQCPSDFKPKQVMVGCGVSGYEWEDDKPYHTSDDPSPVYVGVKEESIKFLHDWINQIDKEGMEWNRQVDEHLRNERGDDYDGHFAKLVDYVFDEEVRAIDLTKGLRFNQGDGYFADQGVISSEIGTKVGKQDEPILMQELKKADEAKE